MSVYHKLPPATTPESASSLVSDVLTNQTALIYFAAPMSTYTHAAYDSGLELVKERYPCATVLSSRDIYRSYQQWQDAWPGLLSIITGLVFIADSLSHTQPTIGYGVYTEIRDCASWDIPVFYLTAESAFIPYPDLQIVLLNGGTSWRWYASIGITGQAVTDGR
jgi:hypothetical protein